MSLFRIENTRARVIFINRFFYPDHSATSQILSDLAFHMAADGRAVFVITSRQRYDDPQAELTGTESIQGVQVHRVVTSHFGRTALFWRAIDYLSFYFSCCWKLWQLARAGDVVVVKTDPPLLSVVVAPIVRLRKAKLVNWLQDLFPEVASALGIRLLRGRLGDWLSRLRDASLRFADINVVLGNRGRAVLLRHGIPSDQIQLIHNWCDDEAIQPIVQQHNSLRHEWGLEGKFVVAYSGNLGRAHDVETILQAAELLNASSGESVTATDSTRCTSSRRNPCPSAIRHGAAASAGDGEAWGGPGRSDIVFLFIGGGHRYRQLQEEVAARGLGNAIFKPYQPRQQLAESLSLGDLHLVSLLPEMEGLIVPSKFYGLASAGRPIMFIGDPDGEVGRMLSLGKCGATVTPGDGAGLAGWIRHLQDNPHLRLNWGRNARRLLDAHFTQRMAFDAWDALVNDLAQENSAVAGRAGPLANDLRCVGSSGYENVADTELGTAFVITSKSDT